MELKRVALRRDALIRLTDTIRDFDDDGHACAAAEILGEALGELRRYGTIDPDAEVLINDRDWNAPASRPLPA